jgi:chromate transport protein ChrA
MYGLAVGIRRVDDTLPAPVYALLTGLNAATVGIIALAAVQLSQKAIKDKLTRILVFAGGTAGMLYNALWYFPLLMIGGGIVTVIWDGRKSIIRFFHTQSPDEEAGPTGLPGSAEMHHLSRASARSTPKSAHSRRPPAPDEVRSQEGLADTHADTYVSPPEEAVEQQSRIVPGILRNRIFGLKFGFCIALCFFLTFIPVMVLRGVLDEAPRGFRLFANMYLAGTIIFGGGPVVIPLLTEWVTFRSRMYATFEPHLMACNIGILSPKGGSLLETFSSASPSSKRSLAPTSTVSRRLLRPPFSRASYPLTLAAPRPQSPFISVPLPRPGHPSTPLWAPS